MPTNPAFNVGSFDSHNTGAYRYDPQNDVQTNARARSNRFDLSETRLDTLRFGEISPFFVVDGVPGDRFQLRSSHELRTWTLKSPMFSKFIMNKDYFEVPLSSIIPNAYEKFYANPLKGDDVPDDSYCKFQLPTLSILEALYLCFRAPVSGIASTSIGSKFSQESPSSQFCQCLGWFSLLMKITSSGSLLSRLGLHTNSTLWYCSSEFEGTATRQNFRSDSLDYMFEHYNGFSNIVTITDSPQSGGYTIDEGDYQIVDLTLTFDRGYSPVGNSNQRSYTSSPQDIRSLLNDAITAYGHCQLSYVHYQYRASSSDNWTHKYFFSSGSPELSSGAAGLIWDIFFPLNQFASLWYLYSQQPDFPNTGWYATTKSFDHSSLIAYQQVCAQFFSVDAIDNLYTSKLWMENMYSLVIPLGYNIQVSSFSYNGVHIPYDTFSLNLINSLYSRIKAFESSLDSEFYFLCNLYLPADSLVYGDYFAGARLEPLAVGDVSISVDSSGGSSIVNALDVTRNLQLQRFLNKVNRTGAQIQDYIRGIFGETAVQIDPQPRFISHESFDISGFEIENTSNSVLESDLTSQQGYPTTLLRTSDSRFSYDIEIGGDPCIIIGVVSFDMRRIYSSTIDRSFFKANRFDFFQPDLQNVGDQMLYLSETGNPNAMIIQDNESLPFGYHLRDTHYKQRYDIALGGFCRQDILPSFANVINFQEGRYAVGNLDSNFIRNHNEDIDKFYASLSGITDSSYYHFLLRFHNNLIAHRNMQVKPLIAG